MSTRPGKRQTARTAERVPIKRRVDLARRAEIGQEKRARTRRQVLDATFTLLGQEGGLTTRIDDICKSAGISRGTFYNYFTGTSDLFEALSYELNHDFNVSVNEVIAALPHAAERVSAAVRYYLGKAAQDERWGWAMVNVSAGGPIFGSDTYQAAQNTAQEGIDANEFDVASAELGRDLQLGVGLAAMLTQLHQPQASDHASQVASRILLALGVKPDRIVGIVARRLPVDL